MNCKAKYDNMRQCHRQMDSQLKNVFGEHSEIIKKRERKKEKVDASLLPFLDKRLVVLVH